MKKVKREAYRGLYLIYKILMLFRKKRDEDSKKNENRMGTLFHRSDDEFYTATRRKHDI